MQSHDSTKDKDLSFISTLGVAVMGTGLRNSYLINWATHHHLMLYLMTETDIVQRIPNKEAKPLKKAFSNYIDLAENLGGTASELPNSYVIEIVKSLNDVWHVLGKYVTASDLDKEEKFITYMSKFPEGEFLKYKLPEEKEKLEKEKLEKESEAFKAERERRRQARAEKKNKRMQQS